MLCLRRTFRRTFSACSALLFIASALGSSWSVAQEPALADLTEQEYAALEVATVNSVTATISFLASDELGGRGTGTKEFDIAAAYVASRLRGAGAEGLGPDGSFFLTYQLPTTKVASGCVLKIEGPTPTPRHSLLEAGEAVEYQGAPAVLGDDGSLPENWSGPVVWTPPPNQPSGPGSPLMALTAKANAAARLGATALLVLTPSDSMLWAQATHNQNTSRLAPRRGGRRSLPIVLVEGEQWPETAAIQLSAPALTSEDVTVRNVIGVLQGSDPERSKEAVLFSAHLDHLGRVPGVEPDPIFNGADDDASGVTAVLTLADIYGSLSQRPARSVIFMTFWGEERGLLGSRAFVENPAWPLEKIIANVNIEMVGRPEEGARNKGWMTGWGQSDLGQLVGAGARRVSVEIFEHPAFSARLYQASDNWSFAQKGVVAHSFSAGSLHSDYHQPSDEWELLDLPHMTQVIRGLFAGTLPIAQGLVTPRKR